MSEIKPYPIDPSYVQLKEPEIKNQIEDTSKYDIVKSTQYGIYSRCVELIASGYDVNQMDSEHVSLLHWAAINNRQDIVKFYVSKGATIDVIGGDLMSTPLHWAVRQGLLDMVALLLKLGSNPNIPDGQGLSCIHVAAQLAYTHIVAYLLAHGVAVDITDGNEMTALMWGVARSSSPDPARLLITWGANVNMQDASGCTAGHYAAMAGNFVAISLLDKAGINWLLMNNIGTTVHQALVKKNMTWVADRVNEMMIARGLLRHKNYFIDLTSSNKRVRLVMMVSMPPVVFLLLGLILHLALNYWIKLFYLSLIFVFVRFGMRLFVDSRAQVLTMFSLATATTFFLCVSYFYFLIPYNTGIVNTLFVCCTSLLWYNFVRACIRDPGYVTVNPSERIHSILAMASADPAAKVTLNRFCTTCLIRKPLRSKHCSVCDRCVARFDHHCPWIYNCVGVNTLANFILYLVALVPSLILFAYGAISYWLHFHVVDSSDPISLVIYKFTVDIFHRHPWILFCTANSLIYLLWVSLLLMAQLYQAVWLNETTNERMNWERFATTCDGAPGSQHGPGSRPHSGDCGAKANKSASPYQMGIVRNLLDIFRYRRSKIDWASIYTLDEFDSHLRRKSSVYERV